jgi:putative ABC transport system permease protein
MALGAKARWILGQFLLETMLVTALGGLIGFGISFALCAVFPEGPQEYIGKPELSPIVAALTAVALGIVGLIAGYFPAREAARLDPVVAMKL